MVHASGESIGCGKGRGHGLRERDVPRGQGQPFCVGAQGAAGMLGLDHSRVRGRVEGPGAYLDQRVQVGGGQAARVLACGGEYRVQPAGVLGVLGRVGGRQVADRGEQGAVGVVGERAGLDPGDVGETVGFEEEGAEEGLLGVVHGLRRMRVEQVVEVVVLVGGEGAGH
jgi:hypothetical protein